MSRPAAAVLAALGAFMVLFSRPTEAGDWNQWRGPGRDGRVPGFQAPEIPYGAIVGPKKTAEIATYPSITEWHGQRVLWYPDRKYYLLGKYLLDALLADMKAPIMKGP
jgi:hypothetical protein